MFLTNIDLLEKFFQFYNEHKEMIHAILTLMVIVLCIMFLLMLKPENKVSKQRLEKNSKNKKYISDIYVEIGDYNEKLRSFSYRKHRNLCRKKFKKIMSDESGKIIFKHSKICFLRLLFPLQLDKLIDEILLFISSIKRGNNELAFANQNWNIMAYELKKIKDQFILWSANCLIVKGNAGNGKTNLICSHTKNLLKNRKHVIYLEAKTVENDIKLELLKTFNANIKNDSFMMKILKIYFKFLSFLNIKINIIVEGINENSSDNFSNLVIDFINEIGSQRNIKLILTMREEYYSYVFKDKYMEFGLVDLSYINIKPIRDDEFDYEQLIKKYRKYFNYNGTILSHTLKLISSSLFMTRLFFETHKNLNDCSSISDSHILFNKYIDSIKDNDVFNFIRTICNIMLRNNKYDYILIDDLVKCGMNYEDIEKLILNSIIISSEIGYDKDKILSYNKKVISFTFDEFRDYCLSLVFFENNYTITEFVHLINNSRNINEGIIKYGYYKLKESNNKSEISEFLGSIKNKYIYVYISGRYPIKLIYYVMGTTKQNLLDIELEEIENNIDISNFKKIILLLLENYIYFDNQNIKSLIHRKKLLYLFNKLDYEYLFNVIEMFDGLANEDDVKKYFLNLLNSVPKNEIYKGYIEPDYRIVLNNDYFLIISDRIISMNKFLKTLSVKQNSFFGHLYCNLYNYLYSSRWNLYKEYTSHYKKEFDNFVDFLLSVYHFPINYKIISNPKKICCKYKYSWFDNSVYQQIMNEELESMLNRLMEEEYYDN